MTYYDTLDEDLARAKAILAKGAPSTWEKANFTPDVVEALRQVGGGTIFGADIYAAYKLLESFVEFIEQTNLACACRLNPYAPEELATECPAHAAVRAERDQLRAERVTAVTARCSVCGAYCDDITVEHAGDPPQP